MVNKSAGGVLVHARLGQLIYRHLVVFQSNLACGDLDTVGTSFATLGIQIGSPFQATAMAFRHAGQFGGRRLCRVSVFDVI